MQRKFALLILGALVALVVPASAMGGMYPAGHSFEIAGSVPKVGTALGNCTISKITGTIPSAPTNETATQFAVSAPTVSTCTAGTTVTFGGEWKLTAPTTTPVVNLGGSAATVTLKFSSLPGCKLSSTGANLFGIWSNGATGSTLLKSGYHPHGAQVLTWSNDGASCAVAGKTESVFWSAETGTNPLIPLSMAVTDTTSPSSVVVNGPQK